MAGERTYLGDGVYAEFDGYQIWLTTSDGIHYGNRIALEPDVFAQLIAFHTRIKATVAAMFTTIEPTATVDFDVSVFPTIDTAIKDLATGEIPREDDDGDNVQAGG